MGEQNYSSSRIAKNTVALYIRSFISMLIALYTSRLLLKALGIDDFGIYNVVGGIVIVLGFVNGSLAGASTRFLTYAIGAEDKEKEKHIFYVSSEKMIGEDREGTVDAIHFTDLGMMRYADVLYPILKRVIK